MIYVKVTYDTGAYCIFEIETFGNFMHEVKEGLAGEAWVVELVEMDREEFASLPEFTGP